MRQAMPVSKKGAEKLFKKKASADSNLSSKAFLKKKVVEPVKKYGRNVAGGAKIVGKGIKAVAKKASKSKGFNSKAFDNLRRSIFHLPKDY